MLFQREGQVVEGDGVVRLGPQGCAVVLDRAAVIALGRQGKAQGVFDQGLGFAGFAAGSLGGKLQVFRGLPVEAFAQLD